MLVVDDSSTSVRVVSHLIKKADKIPISVFSLAQALDVLNDQASDEFLCAVVDYTLPDAPRGEAIEAVLKLAGIRLNPSDLIELKAKFSQQHQPDTIAADLVNDTRAIKPGDVFCAVIGSLRDGREYIAQALAANCSMIIQETTEPSAHGQVSWVQKTGTQAIAILNYFNLNQDLFNVAKAFYLSLIHI